MSYSIIQFRNFVRDELTELIQTKQNQLGDLKEWDSVGTGARLAGHIQGLKQALIAVEDASERFTRQEDADVDLD